MADNASNNDRTIDLLGYDLPIDPNQCRLRCAGHIINLVTKVILFGTDVDCIIDVLCYGDEDLLDSLVRVFAPPRLQKHCVHSLVRTKTCQKEWNTRTNNGKILDEYTLPPRTVRSSIEVPVGAGKAFLRDWWSLVVPRSSLGRTTLRKGKSVPARVRRDGREVVTSNASVVAASRTRVETAPALQGPTRSTILFPPICSVSFPHRRTTAVINNSIVLHAMSNKEVVHYPRAPHQDITARH